MSSKRTEKELFTVMKEHIVTFLSNCSMRTKNDIQELEYSEACTIVRFVAKLVLTAFVKVIEFRAH